MYKTGDGGTTWHAISKGLEQVGSIGDIKIDPSHTDTVYAANDYTFFGNRAGILKTVDGGETWHESSDGIDGISIDDIEIDPSSTDTLYAASLFGGVDPEGNYIGGGIFKSADGGHSWKAITNGLPSDEFFGVSALDLAIDPSSPNVIYAVAGALSSGLRLFKSTDAGASWTRTGLLEDAGSIALDPAHPTTLYATVGNGLGWASGIAKSTNGGATWVRADAGLTLGAYEVVRDILINPKNTRILYASTAAGLFVSSNGGGHWTLLNDSRLATFFLTALLDPSYPTTMYAGTTTPGVVKSLDGGRTWLPANVGLREASVGQIVLDPSDGATAYAGLMDFGGVYKTTNGGETWFQDLQNGIWGNGIGALAVDPSAPKTLYAGVSCEGCSALLYKTVDGGGHWSLLRNFGGFQWIQSLVVDPSSPSTVYMACVCGDPGFDPAGSVYKTVDGGKTWTCLCQAGGSSEGATLGIDPSRARTIYNGWGDLEKSTDGGTTWTQLGLPVAGGYWFIKVDPSSSSTVYTDGGYGPGDGIGGVLRSLDGGKTWSLIGPPAPPGARGDLLGGATDLVIDRGSSKHLFAATQWAVPVPQYPDLVQSVGGIFGSKDGGKTWKPVDRGLTDLPVWDLTMSTSHEPTLWAATSRGVFKYVNGHSGIGTARR